MGGMLIAGLGVESYMLGQVTLIHQNVRMVEKEMNIIKFQNEI